MSELESTLQELNNVAAESVQHKVLINPFCCHVKLVLGLFRDTSNRHSLGHIQG